MKKKFNVKSIPVVTFLILIFYELIFSLLVFESIAGIIFKILQSLITTTIITLLTSLPSNLKIKKILWLSLITFISTAYILYLSYWLIFENTLTLNTILNAHKALEFYAIALNKIIKNWYIFALLLMPLISIIFLKNLKFSSRNTKMYLTSLLINIICFYSFILLDYQSLYSAKNLYFYLNNPTNNIKKFGLLTSIRLDIQRTITNFEEKPIILENTYNNTTYTANALNVDFVTDHENEKINSISAYLSNQPSTNKNSYTGTYANKNLIIFLAESFHEIAVNKELTPTLYEFIHNGFYFKNYYTPLFPVSTADSQYMLDTSLIPAEGTWSIESVAGNYIPYSLPNLLKKEGYKTYAYHNYDYDYYNRHKYLETLGYESYIACGNGLEKRMDCSGHPSDLDMLKTTVNDYINDDNFLVYYTTISGHAEYKKTDKSVKRNYEAVKNLPYKTELKYYLATQIELDNALKYLKEQLIEHNKLEDTVIVLLGDHVPYTFNIDEMNTLSTYKRDNTIEKYHSNLIIYNSETPQTTVKKYSSTIDVLPTILNLFGINYDSRLLIGKDIFSNSNDLVIFSSRSFITNKGRYNSAIEIWQGDDISDNYLENIQTEIYHKYYYSRLILETNYYQYIKNY